MSPTITPTITAEEPHGYRAQVEKLEMLPAVRWHIDIADGQLAPRRLISPDQLWWPANVQVDLHVMYRSPAQHLALFTDLHPRLIIVHAEADGDFMAWAQALHAAGIEVGVALLPDTPAEVIVPALDMIDHVLIFSGNLGYQGGSHANLELLSKVEQLKSLKPTLEIGWDGGVNPENAAQLAAGGVDVLNVGGYLQNAADIQAAYGTLEKSL